MRISRTILRNTYPDHCLRASRASVGALLNNAIPDQLPLVRHEALLYQLVVQGFSAVEPFDCHLGPSRPETCSITKNAPQTYLRTTFSISTSCISSAMRLSLSVNVSRAVAAVISSSCTQHKSSFWPSASIMLDNIWHVLFLYRQVACSIWIVMGRTVPISAQTVHAAATTRQCLFWAVSVSHRQASRLCQVKVLMMLYHQQGCLRGSEMD